MKQGLENRRPTWELSWGARVESSPTQAPDKVIWHVIALQAGTSGNEHFSSGNFAFTLPHALLTFSENTFH